MSEAGSRRWARQSVAAVSREADILEQDNACVNGTPGCPGRGAKRSLPCSACFLGTGGDDGGD